MLKTNCHNCVENEINLNADNIGKKINYYGSCSNCKATFDYDKDMVGQVVRNNSKDKEGNLIPID